LLQYETPKDPTIEKGIDFIITEKNHTGDKLTYPVGIGLPKQFYIRYHSYPHVFALLACNLFLKKLNERG
jgi:sporulenol synthase